MKLYPYIQIARPDHWFKNVFMIPGVLLFFFFHPEMRDAIRWLPIFIGFSATCLIASSNYVMNEILDAAKDRYHPVKCNRPVPSGQVKISIGWAWWVALSVIGLLLGFSISLPMGFALAALWIAGCAYNVPPVRTKDKPYLDVLSESINNPLRLLLGWYSTGFGAAPPASALLAYWRV
jgi:decaprenyl-phosphate phosphoribosyltransferase